MSKFLVFGFWILAFGISASEARAATLSVQPSSGTFQVGSTFDVSVYVDTQRETVNAIEAYLQFPPDKLQLVSPTTGASLIDLWISQPRYNNAAGTVELKGGIPEGANLSQGLISKLMFRVKSTGQAVVRFGDASRILLHDGQGTNVLTQTYNGVYGLALPPPAGPLVVSQTHPDETTWYRNSSVTLAWAKDADIEGYSYVLNKEPVDIPDDVSQGARNGVTYQQLADGKHYFHLKALREGMWGGVTHFSLQVDTTPPAEFPLEIFPSAKTTERQPTVRFTTTDNFSGVERYEFKIIPLSWENAAQENEEQPFFFEAQSPHVLASPLELGTYDVIVRTYDKAGNFRDVAKRMRIVTPLFQAVGSEGLTIKGIGVVPWVVLWLVLGTAVALFGFFGWRFRKKYLFLSAQRLSRNLPGSIQKQLQELQKYQKKYGKFALIFFLGSAALLGAGTNAFAQPQLSPPVISEFSQSIGNDEIFYVGGVTEFPNTKVAVFLQDERTGELTSAFVVSGEKGEWFYRHDAFLSPGSYVVWAQGERGEEKSTPSPQRQLSVHSNAFEFGATTIGYEVLALGATLAFAGMVLAATLYMVFHMRRARRKHKEFQKEVREAEESIRRGFAVLKRDIQAELALLKKGKHVSSEQKKQEEQLLGDLAWAEGYIGKEVWDVAETEHMD